MAIISKVASRNNGTLYSGGYSFPDKPDPIPNPGYFQALRSGEAMPIGPWSRTFVESEAEGASVFDASYTYHLTYSDIQYDNIITGDIHWPGDDHFRASPGLSSAIAEWPDPVPSLKNEAVNRAKNSAWDIGTFAAEADKTYDLVRNAHNRTFQRAYEIFRRYGGRWGRGATALMHFASAWMEYRYGWRILMYDLEAAQESAIRLGNLAKSNIERGTAYHERIEKHTRVTSGTTCFMPSSGLGSKSLGFAGTNVNNHATTTLKVQNRVGAGVRTNLLSSFTINPLLTGWELIPFSFIVDWFFDVGNVIGASSPTVGRDLQYLWHSQKRTYETTMITSWAPAVDHASNITPRGNAGQRTTKFRRIYYDRVPTSFEAWNLTWNPRLTLQKFIDLGALTHLRDVQMSKRIARGF